MLGDWCSKLSWMLISFKLWSFVTLTLLLVLAWVSAEKGFNSTIQIAKDLHDKGYINSEQLANLITHSQTVYMDSLLGHVSVFGAAVLVSIIALKAASEWGAISKDKEIIRKVNKQEMQNGGLKKFLSKAGQ